MAIGEKTPTERTKSPDELAAEKIESAIKNRAAERFVNPESSLLRNSAPGSDGVKMPRFADGFPIPARNQPYLLAEAAEKGYTSGRWLKSEDLEFMGVASDQLQGEPTYLVSWGNAVHEGQRDADGQLVPNERYGGYQTEARQISDAKRVIVTPVWNLDQTPLADAPPSEPQQAPTLENVWNVLHSALTQKGIKIEAKAVAEPGQCRIARTPDTDPHNPGTILVGLHPDMEVDHLIYHAMQALDVGLDAMAAPKDRRRTFGSETEARVRLSTVIASLGLQERLPRSYPPNGDTDLGQWENYVAGKGDDKGMMFGFTVSSFRGRGATDNLYQADLIPKGVTYAGESLFGDGDGPSRTAAWSDTFDEETARIFGIGTEPEPAPAPDTAGSAADAEGGRDVPF